MTIISEDQMKVIEENYKRAEQATKDFAQNVKDEISGPEFKTAAGTYMIGRSISLVAENVIKGRSFLYTPNPVLPMVGLFAGGITLLGLAQKQRKTLREIKKAEFLSLMEEHLNEIKSLNNKVERLKLIQQGNAPVNIKKK